MKTKFLLVSISFFFFLISCRPYPDKVEQALILSGNHKEELIKVLEYYRDKDDLKFDAACFLIGNMPYHKSKIQQELPAAYYCYFRKIDSICRTDSDAVKDESLKRCLGKIFDSIPIPLETQSKPDIQFLSADYLIDNIELAFDEWQSSALLRQLSFDDFKEWILPYRTVDESLVDDKRTLRSIIFERLTEEGMTDIRKPIDCYRKYVRLQKEMNDYITSSHHVGPFDPFIPAFKMDCHNLAARTCNYFRACGIPVVYEFTPQWPDKDSKHYWCASPDSNHVLQPYTPPYNNLREDWDSNLKYVGKVFQRTFGTIENSPYFLKNKGEIVPSYFDVATIKDVTERYHLCKALTIPIKCNSPNNLAYLSFFNTKENLMPVAWGEVNKCKRSVTFLQVPVNMLFFPTYMSEDGGLSCFGNPFIFRYDSVTKQVVCKEAGKETGVKIPMHLLRKYPSKKHLDESRKTLQGAHLLGADDWDGPYDTLFVIKNVPGPYWQEYCFSNLHKYRYYRFAPKDGLPMDIAEFEFLGKKDTKHSYSIPTKLPVFSKAMENVESDEYMKVEGTPMKTGPLYSNFFDGDPETYTRWGYLGMDFKSPVCVSRIRLLPRTALNMIEPSQRYQLLYFKDGSWIEHAILVSRYNYLDIDSVPAGTVYWLRNLDKGNEELPFFYENGKQIFINRYTQ